MTLPRLVVIKTKTMVFEDYFFDRDNCRVISVKKEGKSEVKKLKDRKTPTWKLSVNGVNYFVTLREIMEFTLGIQLQHRLTSH